ncbi:hypothetical protein BJ508DRAFT_417761 [Ascobolus immersus RN42]|uniref:Cora-domain-containing protein n=1 Tax=Ascobolus immersus RN42 TaxID=1160509 RepID=A0A3N4HQC7_ASCIM|nr:hypothetical protein BJ508DRAFT_417761 [Ascobolus immersus RN42]
MGDYFPASHLLASDTMHNEREHKMLGRSMTFDEYAPMQNDFEVPMPLSPFKVPSSSTRHPSVLSMRPRVSHQGTIVGANVVPAKVSKETKVTCLEVFEGSEYLSDDGHGLETRGKIVLEVSGKADDLSASFISGITSTLNGESKRSEHGFTWIHLHATKHMSLDDFKACVLDPKVLEVVGADGHQYVDEVIGRLHTHEKKFSHGNFMEELAFRVKGKVPEGTDEVNKHSATFISFPYCETREADPSTDDFSPKHVPRTLLQTLYRSYSTKKIDSKPPSESVDFGNIPPVHVMQLWALIIKERILVTYSYQPFEKLLEASDLEKKPIPRQSVRFTVTYGDPPMDGNPICFHYPAEECRTWIELERNLMTSGAIQNPEELEDLVTTTCRTGSQPVDPRTWATILKNINTRPEPARFIDLRLQGRTSNVSQRTVEVVERGMVLPPLRTDRYEQPDGGRLGSIPHIHEPTSATRYTRFGDVEIIEEPLSSRGFRNSISNRSIYGQVITPRASGAAIHNAYAHQDPSEMLQPGLVPPKSSGHRPTSSASHQPPTDDRDIVNLPYPDIEPQPAISYEHAYQPISHHYQPQPHLPAPSHHRSSAPPSPMYQPGPMFTGARHVAPYTSYYNEPPSPSVPLPPPMPYERHATSRSRHRSATRTSRFNARPRSRTQSPSGFSEAAHPRIVEQPYGPNSDEFEPDQITRALSFSRLEDPDVEGTKIPLQPGEDKLQMPAMPCSYFDSDEFQPVRRDSDYEDTLDEESNPSEKEVSKSGKVQIEPYSEQPHLEANLESSVASISTASLQSSLDDRQLPPAVQAEIATKCATIFNKYVTSPKRNIPPVLCWTPWKHSKNIPDIDPTTKLSETGVVPAAILRVGSILSEAHLEISRLRVPYVQYKGAQDYSNEFTKPKSLGDFVKVLAEYQLETQEIEVNNRDLSTNDRTISLPDVELHFRKNVAKTIEGILELLAFFVPLDIDVPVLRSVWGILSQLAKVPFSTDNRDALKRLNASMVEFKEMAETIAYSVEDWERTYPLEFADDFPYHLSSHLRSAFNHIVLFLVCFLRKEGLLESKSSQDVQAQHKGVPGLIEGICKLALKKGRTQILLMKDAERVYSTPTLPLKAEQILSIVLEHIETTAVKQTTVAACFPFMDRYTQIILQLQLYMQQHPSRRLLQDINALDNELKILEKLTVRRFKLIQSWFKLRTINPLRFPTGYYRTERILEETRVSLSDIHELKHQMSQLRSQTVQLVDLITEDQEKAIFLFTFITVFFTPLTFVTSFFGMNTTDIRDMAHSQSTFWAAAIPVTVIIVAVSAVSVYKGTDIKKWWRRRRQRRERRTGKIWGQM